MNMRAAGNMCEHVCVTLGTTAHFFCVPAFRNSAAETVEQELLFVGSETGKLTAMRELVKKVIGRDGGRSACGHTELCVLSETQFPGTKASLGHMFIHCPDLVCKRKSKYLPQKTECSLFWTTYSSFAL